MKPRKALIPFLFAAIVLSAFSPMLTTRKAQANPAYPLVSITPAASFGTVGEDLSVDVIISNVVDLFMYEIHVDFSPGVLSVINVTEGDLLKRGEAYTTFWRTIYDNNEGVVKAANSLLRGAQPVTGIGQAFRITFTVNKAGGSLLHPHNIMMATQFGADIAPILVQDATISTAKLELAPSMIRPTTSNDLSINKTFNVNVTLAGQVSELYTYDLNLTYGNDVLEATSATLLPFMGTPNSNQTQINNDNGTIRLSLKCNPPAASTNTTGTIATIAFKVVKLGSTHIEISEDSTLADEEDRSLFPTLGSASFNNRYATRNIGILDSTLSSYEVTAGDSVTETIIVRNQGSTNETCEAVVHAQNTIAGLIGGPSTFTIEANTSQTITMTLKTDGLGGNYTVNVFFFYLPEETTYQDNDWTITQPLLVHAKEAETSTPFGTVFYVSVVLIVILIAATAAYILVRKRKAH